MIFTGFILFCMISFYFPFGQFMIFSFKRTHGFHLFPFLPFSPIFLSIPFSSFSYFPPFIPLPYFPLNIGPDPKRATQEISLK